LFIYQPLNEKYGKQGTNYLLSKLPQDCISISFPYIYFAGYWPNSSINPLNKPGYIHEHGILPYGDWNINNMFARGYTKTEIIEELNKTDFYSQDFLLTKIESTLEELSTRESNTDVKVANFIRYNYKDIHLFHTPNHPSNLVGFEAANQILRILGIPPMSTPFCQK